MLNLRKRTQNINLWLAVKGTSVFSTMWTFYAFFIWGLLAFVPALSHYKEVILLISSAWIQLWALPMISVGNAVLGKKMEEQSQQDHVMITHEFEMLKQQQELWKLELKEDREMLDKIYRIQESLDRIESKLP